MNHKRYFEFRFRPRAICSIDGGGESGGGAVAVAAPDAGVAADVSADTAIDASVDTALDTAGAEAEAETAEVAEIEGEADGAQDDKPADKAPDTQTPEDGVSSKVKGLIESLKKTDPQAAKDLKNLAYAQAALRKEFPGGLKEVQALKATMNELAGEAGLEALKQTVTTWKSLDDRFAAGDATVLSDFQKFNPEAFDKVIPPAINMLADSNAAAFGDAMPAAIDKLSQVSPETYSHYMAGVLTATLDNYKVADTLQGLVRSLGTIKDGDGHPIAGEEIESITALLNTLSGFRELSKKAPAPKQEEKPAEDPKKSEYEAKLQEIQQREQAAVVQKLREGTNTHATTEYDKLLTTELKGLNIPKGSKAYESIVRDIDEMIGREIDADKSFGGKLAGLIAAGKTDDAVKLANARFDQSSFKATRHVVSLWSRDVKGTAAKKPGAQGAGAQPAAKPAGVVEVDKAPPSDQVDWSRTSRQDYMWGRNIYLKGDNRTYKVKDA